MSPSQNTQALSYFLSLKITFIIRTPDPQDKTTFVTFGLQKKSPPHAKRTLLEEILSEDYSRIESLSLSILLTDKLITDHCPLLIRNVSKSLLLDQTPLSRKLFELSYPKTNNALFPNRTTSPGCRTTVLLFTA